MKFLPLVGLGLAAFAAGVVDAIGGGGGLITLPALLAAGFPPHLALGTNKGQSVFGSGSALRTYYRSGLIQGTWAKWTFPLGLIGSWIGAALVSVLAPSVLRPVVIAGLIVVGLVMMLRPSVASPRAAVSTRWPVLSVSVIAFVIAAYDGFFGPGTGLFLIAAFVWWMGSSPLAASADAKVVNFASNLAAVAYFGWKGFILWPVALVMGVGQFAGGQLGARLAIRRGDTLVRGAMVVVVVLLAAKLIWER